MGIKRGPQIVKDGLQVHLDASSVRSWTPNVHPNPRDIYGWCGAASTNQSTISRDSSTGASPAKGIPMKMVVSGTDPYIASYASSTWNLAPAASGQVWTVSVWVKASTNTTGQIFIFEAASDGTLTGSYSAGTVNISTSWQRVSYTRTLSNASTAYVQTRLDGPNAGGSMTIWWDGMQVEKSSTPTDFNRKTSPNGTSWFDLSSYASLFNSSVYTYPTMTKTGGASYFTFVNNGTTSNNILSSTTNVTTTTQNAYSRFGVIYMTSLPGAWGAVIQNTIGNNSDMGLTVLSNGKLHFRHYTRSKNNGTTSGDYGVSSTGATLSTNTWYYVGMVVNRSAQTVKFYVNGSLDSSVSIDYMGNAGSNQMVIGGAYADSYSGARMFKGRIAQVSHYNRELTPAEVLQNFNAVKGRFGI